MKRISAPTQQLQKTIRPPLLYSLIKFFTFRLTTFSKYATILSFQTQTRYRTVKQNTYFKNIMSGELTQLGKFLRKLRIDRGELLRTMAEKLGISMSFLSSVENGKKNMPTEWITKIPDLYQFNNTQKSEFDQAVAESEKGIGLKFEGLSEENKRISVAFARKIKTLSPEAQKAIQDLLF